MLVAYPGFAPVLFQILPKLRYSIYGRQWVLHLCSSRYFRNLKLLHSLMCTWPFPQAEPTPLNHFPISIYLKGRTTTRPMLCIIHGNLLSRNSNMEKIGFLDDCLLFVAIIYHHDRFRHLLWNQIQFSVFVLFLFHYCNFLWLVPVPFQLLLAVFLLLRLSA